jgi:hypothetical protein
MSTTSMNAKKSSKSSQISRIFGCKLHAIPVGVSSAIAALAFSAIALTTMLSCSMPDADDRFQGTFPDQTQFQPVADMMIHRCGSLDCHGQPGRNLRIAGTEGMRLAPGDTPSPPGPSTTDEYAADYRAVCGLEPEVMTAVVNDKGANPERLTMVQKARATQEHKGGAVIIAGDVQDKCMLSWLAGTADTTSCSNALNLP